MNKIRYTPQHEWISQEEAGLFTVGITPYAQHALGDIVYVQLPGLRIYSKNEEVVIIESVKAASSIEMPFSGEVVEINTLLDQSPEVVNTHPMADGWFFRFRANDIYYFNSLLDESSYDRLLKAEAES